MTGKEKSILTAIWGFNTGVMFMNTAREVIRGHAGASAAFAAVTILCLVVVSLYISSERGINGS